MSAPARNSLAAGLSRCHCLPHLVRARHTTCRLTPSRLAPARSSFQSVRRLATAVDAHNCAKPPLYGQPMPDTHPHLIQKGDITPGISAMEYHTRRKALMDSLPEGSVAVSVGGRIKYMSQSIFYKFRQASDFWYLTGFQEPDSAAVLEKTSDSKGYRMTLFLKPKNAEHELWEGASTGIEAAVLLFGADQAFPMADLTSQLRSILSAATCKYVYVDGSPKTKSKKTIFDYLSPSSSKADYDSILGSCRAKIKELAPEVSKMRAIKSEAEQRILRKAGEISGRAHASTMAFTSSARTEAQLAAHFEYDTAMHGAQRLAYVPVVASGANARIIHYVNNDCTLQPGELVLMDAGAEYNGYASDITRTWPVSGKFTDPQRDLYQAVLNCEKACIELCTANSGLSMNDLHRKSCELLKQELKQIGFQLRSGDVERILYPHFLSHPIGIDLHESTYDRSRSLRSGMVLTIEPGIYVPPDSAFPTHFHNLGVRIEDCVLVQPDHSVILSVNAPKEIADVEGVCQHSLS